MLQWIRDFIYDEYDPRRYDRSGDAETYAAMRMFASGFILGGLLAAAVSAVLLAL